MKTILKGHDTGALFSRRAKAAPTSSVSANPYSPVLSVVLLLAVALIAKSAPLVHSLMATN